jgi:hypothetical protein
VLGDLRRAGRFLGAADHLRSELGVAPRSRELRDQERRRTMLASTLGAEELAAELAAGAHLDVAIVVEEGLRLRAVVDA